MEFCVIRATHLASALGVPGGGWRETGVSSRESWAWGQGQGQGAALQRLPHPVVTPPGAPGQGGHSGGGGLKALSGSPSEHPLFPRPPLLYFWALQMLTGGQSGRKSVFSAQAWESEKPRLQSGATAFCLCDLGHMKLCEPQLLRL